MISDIVENIRCVGSFEDIDAAGRSSVRNRSETFFWKDGMSACYVSSQVSSENEEEERGPAGLTQLFDLMSAMKF